MILTEIINELGGWTCEWGCVDSDECKVVDATRLAVRSCTGLPDDIVSLITELAEKPVVIIQRNVRRLQAIQRICDSFGYDRFGSSNLLHRLDGRGCLSKRIRAIPYGGIEKSLRYEYRDIDRIMHTRHR